MTQPEESSGEGRLRRTHASDDEVLHPGLLAWPAAILLAVTALIAGDVVGDARAGSSSAHIAVEALAMVLAVGGAAALWLKLLLIRRRARALSSRLTLAHSELSLARDDLARFRAESEEAMRGLGAAIDRQFGRWGLSAAEREVALLLLKGLPSKEIAGVRNTSERTVRQQALAVYRKAGLTGRAELAAFFLEDLLLPTPAEPGRSAPVAR